MRTSDGHYFVTATFEGLGRWHIAGSGRPQGAGNSPASSSEGCSSFVGESNVGLAFLVVTLDVNGDPIGQSFTPYYGTSQKVTLERLRCLAHATVWQ